MSNRFPIKPPVPPCIGWLAHNTQCCECYAEERKAWLADLQVDPIVRFGRSLKKLFGRA